jgi:hypothetical protein
MFAAKPANEEAWATPVIPRQTAMATKQQNLFIFPAPFFSSLGWREAG